MKKTIRRILRTLAGLLILCLLSLPFLFEKIDRTPYRQMPYYQQMMAQLDTFQTDSAAMSGSFLKAGWSKKNITPSYPLHLAGYGLREKFDCIHDSVFVRTFVFFNGKTKAVFITPDLLIFPPVIEKRLRDTLSTYGYKSENLYLSATHTHSAPGGWANGPAGRILAGSYDEKYVSHITAQIVASVAEAEKNLDDVTTGFAKLKAKKFVRNRLHMPDSRVDPWIRILKVRKKSGASAAIITYSAHANCLNMSYSCVSADYPSRMIEEIEKNGKVDFALYAAGMVGSHSPQVIYNRKGKELTNLDFVNYIADSLALIVSKNIDTVTCREGNLLMSAKLKLHLREPHLKVARDWRVRPWLFRSLFGPYDPDLKLLRINNVLFLGTPCDFSGEIMPDLEQISSGKKLDLVITSFNGGYIGYINVDKYYDEDKAEMRDMNWFGPYNQAYFTEVINKILKKI